MDGDAYTQDEICTACSSTTTATTAAAVVAAATSATSATGRRIALKCTTICQSSTNEDRAFCGRALLSSSLIRAACAPARPRFDFRRPAPSSPPPHRPFSLPNRDALCATKHLARASSCLYVAAYSPSSTTFSFSLLLSLARRSFLSLSLTHSPTLVPPTRAPGESLSPGYPPDVYPLRFEFLTRFPSQISLSPCPFRRTRTISSKRCSVIRHGFRENMDFCSFFPLPRFRLRFPSPHLVEMEARWRG